MQLIACPECRRQYDVTSHPVGESVRCLCDHVFVVEHHTPHSPRPVRCAGCGGPLAAAARSCTYCENEVTLEERRLSAICPACYARMSEQANYCMECGITISPQALIPIPEDAPCPRCKADLRTRHLGETSVVECSSCGGLWLPPASFTTLCRDAERAAQVEARLFRQAPEKEPPGQKFRYLPCLVCKDFMVPRNFAQTSGVIIDVCREHGVWLDHRELERITAFIKSAGLDGADPLGPKPWPRPRPKDLKFDNLEVPSPSSRYASPLVDLIWGFMQWF